MDKPNIVAVYGSLREGLGNWRWYLSSKAEAEKISTEKIKGFKMVSLGGYPAIYTSKDESEITIEVYKVTDKTFKGLDGLEGYPSFYNRKEVMTSKGKAWIYFIDSIAEKSDQYTHVENGDWVDFRSSQ